MDASQTLPRRGVLNDRLHKAVRRIHATLISEGGSEFIHQIRVSAWVQRASHCRSSFPPEGRDLLRTDESFPCLALSVDSIGLNTRRADSW